MWARLRARLRGLLRHQSIERELDEELRFHVEQETRANLARGMAAPEARRTALRNLGGLTATRDTVRDVRSRWTAPVWRDLAYALRTLRATPGVSIVAAVTLALAVGANGAIYSVVRGILLAPLPYDQSDRLALLVREQDMRGAHRPVPLEFFAPADIDAWRRSLQSFESTALYTTRENAALSTESGSDVIDSAVVSDSFFSTMRGAIVAGRFPGPADDMTNSVAISERLADRLFGRPEAALGQVLTLSSRPYTVIGVASRSFQFPKPTTDVWEPAGFARRPNSRCCSFNLIGRLRTDRTVADADAEARGLAVSLRQVTPDMPSSMRASAVGLRDRIVQPARPALLILFAAAGLVLFVACANVAQLLLARQASRSRDRAIRSALGASRARLIRQSLLEVLLLSILASLVGVVIAGATIRLLVRAVQLGIPRLDAVRFDGSVLLFSAVLCLLTALGTGLAPALQGPHPIDVLKTGAAGMRSSGRERRLYGVLSVAQLAVSLVLIVGATLFGRSLVRLLNTDLGVSTDHLVTASMNVAFGGRPTDEQTRIRFDRVVDRIRTVPGVQAVGLGTGLPPATSRIRLTMRATAGEQEYQASAIAATPGYFQALGLRLLKGRLFTDADTLDSPQVVIMSADTARRLFGQDDPIGRTMKLPGTRDGKPWSDTMTLVGVVSNVKYSGLENAADDSVYRPFTQQTWVAPFLVARTAGSPEALAPAIRREIGLVDREIVISDVKTMDAILSDATASPRFRTVLLAAIAGLAVTIASIGLYGVIAQAVGQRTREIGVRMALGADRGDIRRMVLSQAGRLGAVGVVCGVGASLLLTRTLTGLLYGIAPTDWISYAAGCGLLMALVVAASYIPARGATRVDPIVVLRAE